MNLDEETKSKIDKLPIVLKTMANYLLDALDNIINGKCDEDTLTSTVGTLNNNAKGRICDEDVLNYDKAGEILGFGTNRNGLKALLDRNGIKQKIINNQKCGFLRSEVMALNDKLVEKRKKANVKKRLARKTKSDEEREYQRLKQEEDMKRIREEVRERRFI